LQFSTENACISTKIIVSAQDFITHDYSLTDNYYTYIKFVLQWIHYANTVTYTAFDKDVTF
jgi:hypothetical protein